MEKGSRSKIRSWIDCSEAERIAMQFRLWGEARSILKDQGLAKGLTGRGQKGAGFLQSTTWPSHRRRRRLQRVSRFLPRADEMALAFANVVRKLRTQAAQSTLSTGTALSAVRLPNRYVTPDVRCNLVSSRRESGGFMVTFVPYHHRPGHPSELVGERNGCDLSGAPGQ